MIELRDVCVSFPDADDVVRAADHVTFAASPGEFVLLCGASGSGKSTLLNVISGLQPMDSGSAFVAGLDLATADDTQLARLRLEHVGVVFQENNLIREFTAAENVQLPLSARGYANAAAAAAAMLRDVGLGELGRRLPTQLSGGQRQRVGIARALVGGRSILVADEPTGSLDTANSIAIFELMRRLADREICVIVASHDPAAARFADRVTSMSDGALSEAVAQ